MKLSDLRKLDYLIFYILFSGMYIIQLSKISFILIATLLILCMIPALVLGTITNLVFRKKQ